MLTPHIVARITPPSINPLHRQKNRVLSTAPIAAEAYRAGRVAIMRGSKDTLAPRHKEQGRSGGYLIGSKLKTIGINLKGPKRGTGVICSYRN